MAQYVGRSRRRGGPHRSPRVRRKPFDSIKAGEANAIPEQSVAAKKDMLSGASGKFLTGLVILAACWGGSKLDAITDGNFFAHEGRGTEKEEIYQQTVFFDEGFPIACMLEKVGEIEYRVGSSFEGIPGSVVVGAGMLLAFVGLFSTAGKAACKSGNGKSPYKDVKDGRPENFEHLRKPVGRINVPCGVRKHGRG